MCIVSEKKMKNFSEHIDLIVKFLSGDANSDESKKLFDRMEGDRDLKKEFEAMQQTWNLSATKPDKEISSINLDAEWDMFSKKIAANDTKVIPITKNKFPFARIAAAVAAIFLIGFAGFYLFNAQTQELVANNTVVDSKLPDGSQISLNAGSELEYAKSFNKKERVVELKGEAFFKVAHNPQKPFIVKAGKLNVEVVGTEFNVDAKSRKGNVEVIVNSGKVLVYCKKDKSDAKLLQAGDKAKFISKKSEIVKEPNTNPNYLAWKTKKMVFENARLEDIIKTLEHTYGKRIIIKNPELKNCTLTNQFDNQSLKSILKVLEATLDVKITFKNGVYEIKGNACLQNN